MRDSQGSTAGASNLPTHAEHEAGHKTGHNCGHTHHDHPHDHAHHHHHGGACGHDHAGHEHHHHHADPATTSGRVLAVTCAANLAFVVLEFFMGFQASSTALVADATHNLSDVLGLALAWWAVALGKKPPSKRYTYGYGSASILAALANAMFLLLICGGIVWEALQRFHEPHSVAGATVTWVAALGILVNGGSAWWLLRGRQDDLNLRGAYLHMLADAAVSAGVVLGGLLVMVTAWRWVDTVICLLIVVVMIRSTWGLMRSALAMALKAVPPSLDLTEIEGFFLNIQGVAGVHDLHVWAMSTTEVALTVHVVMPDGYPGDQRIDQIAADLQQTFGIQHCTLQVEQGTTTHHCSLAG